MFIPPITALLALVQNVFYAKTVDSFILQRLKSTNALNCDLQGQNEALRRRVDEQLPSADGGEYCSLKHIIVLIRGA